MSDDDEPQHVVETEDPGPQGSTGAVNSFRPSVTMPDAVVVAEASAPHRELQQDSAVNFGDANRLNNRDSLTDALNLSVMSRQGPVSPSQSRSLTPAASMDRSATSENENDAPSGIILAEEIGDMSNIDFVPYASPVPPLPWYARIAASIHKCCAYIVYPFLVLATCISLLVIFLFCIVPALICLSIGISCYYCWTEDPIPISVLMRYVLSTDDDANNDFSNIYSMAQKRSMVQENLIFRELTKIEDERSSMFLADDQKDEGGDGLSKYPRHFPFSITVHTNHKKLHFSAPIKFEEPEKDDNDDGDGDDVDQRNSARNVVSTISMSARRGSDVATDYRMGAETLTVVGGDGTAVLGNDGHTMNFDIESLPHYQRPVPNTRDELPVIVEEDPPFVHKEAESAAPIESLDEIRIEVRSGLEPVSMDDFSETGQDQSVSPVDSAESGEGEDNPVRLEEGNANSNDRDGGDDEPNETSTGTESSGGIINSIINTFVGESSNSGEAADNNERSGNGHDEEETKDASSNTPAGHDPKNPLRAGSTAATVATKVQLAVQSVEDAVNAAAAAHTETEPSPPNDGDFFGVTEDTRDRGTTCDICLLDYEVGDIVAWSPNISCNHVYHKECILDWLIRKPTCPNCRTDFTKSNSKDKKRRRR